MLSSLPRGEKRLFISIKLGQPKEYQDFIAEVNKELDLLDFSLKVAHAESDGTSYLAFINGKGDFFTESATRFKPAELSYCRELASVGYVRVIHG